MAKYNNLYYIAQVEGEECEEEIDGYTLLKYMERKGRNGFLWVKDDLFKTRTVSSRLFGLFKQS